MKKRVTGVLVALIFLISANSYAEVTKKVLIDFNTFEEKMDEVLTNDFMIHERMLSNQSSGMELDYTKYGYQKVIFTSTDWALSNWQVALSSSARTVKNNLLSYCMKITNSKRFTNVLGARVHFPEWRFLSWAMVKPPFEFFVYHDNGRYVNDTNSANDDRLAYPPVENSREMGALINVGQIKLISSYIYGLYYPHGVAIRLKNREGIVQEYFLGHTQFRGWRKLTWVNPMYVSDIRDRVLKKIALYPQSYPHITFDSFVIYKPEDVRGGDYITYFKDVVVHFDRAIVKTEQDDIEDEEYWKILSTKRIEQKKDELVRISETIYLKKQEEQKMSGEDTKLGAN